MPKNLDPKAKLARADELREQARSIEGEAIRDALAASNWLVKPAAALLARHLAQRECPAMRAERMRAVMRGGDISDRARLRIMRLCKCGAHAQ